ncbi:MAG TPA: pyridoxal phosphate-dependent aminotransferase [Bacteroidales bacterium]|nr:pyridoxal phosphate-dependent aminotransferase [Bacteroidales bacterium]
MIRLSDRVNGLAESETLAMSRMCRELAAKGHHVINLSIGEPDFYTPDYIKQAAKDAIDLNYTFYSPVPGYKDLRDAICLKFKRDNHLDYTPEQIVVSAGAKHSIANAVLCLVNPGDEVLLPTPYWVSYRELVKLAEGVPVYIPALIENDFKVTARQIENALTERTRLIIFSSPCNPTGSVYTKTELRELAGVLASKEELYIISDEIYELINFTGTHESIAQFDFIKDKVVTVNGVSKGFAMTGWRLGYMGAPRQIAAACDKLQGQMTSGTSSIAQRAALSALLSDPKENDDLRTMIQAFRERRDLVINELNKIHGFRTNIPEGAFYVFPNIRQLIGKRYDKGQIKCSDDLCNYLLNKAFVATVPGTAFGDPDCVRISYATSSERILEAMARIRQAIEELS